MKRAISFVISILAIIPLTSCSPTSGREDVINPNLDLTKNISLNIVGRFESFPAIDLAAEKFHKKYPNATITYEYMANYTNTTTGLAARLAEKPESVDLFITDRVTVNNAFLPYSLDIMTKVGNGFSLEDTFSPLVDNFVLDDGTEVKKLPSIPLGGDMRGLFVNKSLLAKYNIAIPSNRSDLIASFITLKGLGCSPIFGNPSSVAQQLYYPYIVNRITSSSDYQATWEKVNNADEAEVLRICDPIFRDVYSNMTNYWYDYDGDRNKYNDLDIFNSSDKTMKAFFNVFNDIKQEGCGDIAYFPSSLASKPDFDRIKKDYAPDIDFDFIPAPVGENGGFSYISPSTGIAINKNGTNVDWSVEFLDYIFCRNINIAFSEQVSLLPNVVDLLEYSSKKLEIPLDRISHLGQATFKYNFFSVVNSKFLSPTSKGNNKKYMIKTQVETDPETGEPIYEYSFYSYDYYLETFKTELAKHRS